MRKKKVLYLITTAILFILLGSNVWAQFLEDWHFKPDLTNDNVIDLELNTGGVSWVKNDLGTFTFQEWGFFQTSSHDYNYTPYTFPGEVTGIFSANGTFSLPGQAILTSGTLQVYYDDGGGSPYGTVNPTDNSYYGTNDGELIATFSLLQGDGFINNQGVPDGQFTTIWQASFLKEGVWLDSNYNDLSTMGPIQWNLGFTTTTATPTQEQPVDPDLAKELSEFSGVDTSFMLNNPADDVLISASGQFKLSQVPEPATMFLLGSGLIGFVGIGRKKFKRNKA